MAGQSNYDRAYLMALSAWKVFGYTFESPYSLARRMGEIGGTHGLNAAAEAIAEDCRQNGLSMSAGRVLKVLVDSLARYRDHINRLNSIEEFTIQDMEQIRAQQFNLINRVKGFTIQDIEQIGAQKFNLRDRVEKVMRERESKPSLSLVIFWVIVLIVVFFLIVQLFSG